MIFGKIMKTKKKTALSFTDHLRRTASSDARARLGRRLYRPDPAGAGGRRAALRLPLGSPGWAGIGELRTRQVPSRSPFFANLLSDISPFHLLVIAQIVLSEEI